MIYGSVVLHTLYNMPTYYYITNTDFVNFSDTQNQKIVKTIAFERHKIIDFHE